MPRQVIAKQETHRHCAIPTQKYHKSTVTYAVKVTEAIMDCAKTIKGLQTDGNGIDMQQLGKLEELNQKAIK